MSGSRIHVFEVNTVTPGLKDRICTGSLSAHGGSGNTPASDHLIQGLIPLLTRCSAEKRGQKLKSFPKLASSGGSARVELT